MAKRLLCRTLDPLLAYQDADIHAVAQMAGTLNQITPKGSVAPGLASSSSVSANGKIWTFKLRPGLKFSDGTPLTSADVVATYKRALTDPADVFVGLINRIKTVTAPNATTVKITVSAPFPSLPYITGYPFMEILPADRLAKKSFYNAPVSAGPYYLVSWGGASQSVWKVNPHYWGPKPVIHQLTMVGIPDPSTRLAEVESGQLAAAVYMPQPVVAHVNPPVRVLKGNLYGFYSLVPNNSVKPFSELGVRKAIWDALDRSQINAVAWGGKSSPLAGFWPPSMPGYNPSISTAQNLPAARAALKGTSCQKGCSATLLYSTTYPGEQEMATVAKANLAQIGINLSLQNMDATALYSKVATRKFDMYISLQQDYSPIPDGLLSYSLQANGGSSANYSFYDAPQMQTLIQQANQNTGAKRAAAIAGINSLFVKDAPYANLTPWTYFFITRLPNDDIQQPQSGLLYIKRGASG